MVHLVKNLLKTVIIFVILLSSNTVYAECCYPHKFKHICGTIPSGSHKLGEILRYLKNDICVTEFCKDGTVLGTNWFYCGVGKCNIFDCNCEGGCHGNKNGLWQEAKKQIAMVHNLRLVDLHDTY